MMSNTKRWIAAAFGVLGLLALVWVFSPEEESSISPLAVMGRGGEIYFDANLGDVSCIVTQPLSPPGSPPGYLLINAHHPMPAASGNAVYYLQRKPAGVGIWRLDLTNNSHTRTFPQRYNAELREVNDDESIFILATKVPNLGLAQAYQVEVVNERGFPVAERDFGTAVCGAGADGVIYSEPHTLILHHWRKDGTVTSLGRKGSPLCVRGGKYLLYFPAGDNVKGYMHAVCELPSMSLVASHPMLSPVFTADGEHLVYLDPSMNGIIWRLSLQDGTTQQLGRSLGYIPQFSSTNFGIAAIEFSATPSLLTIDAASNQLHRIPLVLPPPPKP